MSTSAGLRIIRMAVIEVDGRQVVLSLHAVVRWWERRRASLTRTEALCELAIEVSEHGAIRTRRPNGVEVRVVRHMLETVGWLVVGNTVFPLAELGDELVATTCIARRGT